MGIDNDFKNDTELHLARQGDHIGYRHKARSVSKGHHTQGASRIDERPR